jgi:hypothetical protein
MRIGQAGHVARKEDEKMHTEFWSGNIKQKDHLEEDLDIDGVIILNAAERNGIGEC